MSRIAITELASIILQVAKEREETYNSDAHCYWKSISEVAEEVCIEHGFHS